MRNRVLLWGMILWGVNGGAFGAEPDAVFDLVAILAPPLNAQVLKQTEKDGIVTEEVRFHSERDGEKDVEIFAFFAYPKGAQQLPAFIWNQGGLSQASPYFPEFGARRGYAALCIDFPLPGYRSTGGYPIVSGLNLTEDPRQAPIYHGAVALLRAVSFLQSRTEVDPQRIGMVGSSWGGFYTTLMAGVDPRLKAAASMFGTGSLQLGNLWWDGGGQGNRFDAAYRQRWRTTLDPAARLPGSKTPLAWFTGTNDNFYWMPALMRSYDLAAGPKHLTLVSNWDHALPPSIDEQTFAWLDAHLQGKTGFNRVTPLAISQEGERLVARWKFQGPRRVHRAELIVSYGNGDWRGRYWLTIPAKIHSDSCRVELPVSAMACDVSGAVLDEQGFRYSTPLVRVEPKKLGIAGPLTPPEYDGCAQWGGFEASHIEYLKMHGYRVPPVSDQAQEGRQSAVLKAGKTPLAPIYATVGWPHRLSLCLRATAPTTVTLQIGGSPAEKTPGHQQGIDVTERWAETHVDYLPPAESLGAVRVTITVPPQAEVLLDDVSFRPVLD